MKESITRSKNKKSKFPYWTIIVYLIIWQAVSMLIGHEILLASPLKVLKTLWEMLPQPEFWSSVLFSLCRIGIGFLTAVILGVVFAVLSDRVKIIKDLLALPVAVIKSTPVASFIVLVLIWVSSKNLSVLISFLMVFPVIYLNVLTGISKIDTSLWEMAKVFNVSKSKRIRYIYISQVMPYFSSACQVALGLCWKAGVAAEVIGIPQGSIGEKLYDAKVYLNTPDLFAWTLVIIAVSIAFEKVFMWVINLSAKKLSGER